jgi:hydroxypyruvate isomerase
MMKRRDFMRTTGAGAGSILAGVAGSVFASPHEEGSVPQAEPFKLAYAPHFGMFWHHAGEGLVDQIEFVADVGFAAFEDNNMKSRPVETQGQIAAAMARRGLRMGVFVAHTIYWSEPNLTSGKEDWQDQFLAEIRESVEVAKRVNAKWMTVVPGHVDLRLEEGYQRANVIESLKRASAILEPHGFVMVLEPLNRRDHPGLFLTEIPQAYEICKAVDSPSCKILDDLYHQQVTEGNLIPNMDAAWDEIAYFQIGDNPGRKEPTTGEINYRNVFKHIHERGYDGILGMEHGNSEQGREGEAAVIEAYRVSDAF